MWVCDRCRRGAAGEEADVPAVCERCHLPMVWVGTPRRSKFNAVPTVVDGRRFHSKAEARRYLVLKGMQKRGLISGLCCQVPFTVAVGVEWDGRLLPKITYVADFTWWEGAQQVVEDVKGALTPLYVLKRQLMIHRFPHLQFREYRVGRARRRQGQAGKRRRRPARAGPRTGRGR